MKNIIFLGTPYFALRCLEALYNNPVIHISAVVTQPDRPQSRGLKLTPTPVKEFATQRQIPTFTPESLSKKDSKTKLLLSFIEENQIDGFVTVAYGNIIPSYFLEINGTPFINIHPSLLPRWRGAAPVQRPIFEGEKTTGVSLMQVVKEVDAGDVYCQDELEIYPDDTYGSLGEKLIGLSCKMLDHYLCDILEGNIIPKKQDSSKVTYAHKWTKDDARAIWSESAETTYNRYRASFPKPGLWTTLAGKVIKIHGCKVSDLHSSHSLKPAQATIINKNRLIIKCGNNSSLEITELQSEGKKHLPAKDWIQGYINEEIVFE